MYGGGPSKVGGLAENPEVLVSSLFAAGLATFGDAFSDARGVMRVVPNDCVAVRPYRVWSGLAAAPPASLVRLFPMTKSMYAFQNRSSPEPPVTSLGMAE